MRIFKQLPSLMNKLNQQSTMNKKNEIIFMYSTKIYFITTINIDHQGHRLCLLIQIIREKIQIIRENK